MNDTMRGELPLATAASLVTDSSTGTRSRASSESSSGSVIGTSSGSNGAASGKNKSNKRKPTSLPPATVEYLKNWMMSPEHIAHPYPTEAEKAQIMQDTGIELKQLTNWFVNNRKRFWKPRVEAKLQEQVKHTNEEVPVLPLTTTASASSLANVVSAPNFRCLLERAVSRDDSLNSTTPPALVSPANSPSRTISNTSAALEELQHCVSDANSITTTTSEEDDDVSLDEIVQHESIDVTVLRPSSSITTPSLEDLTVLPNVPPERVLRVYAGCVLRYRVTGDRKKTATRRDAEIVKIKKHVLKQYAAEERLHEATSLTVITPNKKRRILSDAEDVVAGAAATPWAQDTNENSTLPPQPRPKYRRTSIEMWKEACEQARDGDDWQLPTMAEAALLFGFAAS